MATGRRGERLHPPVYHFGIVDARYFLQSYVDYFQDLGFEGIQLMSFLPCCLKGDSLLWFLEHGRYVDNWGQFCTFFIGEATRRGYTPTVYRPY